MKFYGIEIYFVGCFFLFSLFLCDFFFFYLLSSSFIHHRFFYSLLSTPHPFPYPRSSTFYPIYSSCARTLFGYLPFFFFPTMQKFAKEQLLVMKRWLWKTHKVHVCFSFLFWIVVAVQCTYTNTFEMRSFWRFTWQQSHLSLLFLIMTIC